MAEVRLTPALPTITPTAPARTTDSVRAAQRAFFDAALNASQTAQPPRPASPAAAASAPATPPPRAASAASAATDPGAAPPRPLRPGSLLDIRI